MPDALLETFAKFPSMDMTRTRDWVRIYKMPVREGSDVTRVAAHSIRQFLIGDNEPPMEVDTDLDLLPGLLCGLPFTSPRLPPCSACTTWT